MTQVREDLKVIGLKSLSQPGMIDCGFDNSYKCKLTGLKKDIVGMEFKYLIISHSHFDHMGGAHHFLKDHPNCKVIAHEAAAENMKEGIQADLAATSTGMKVLIGVSGLFSKTKKNKKLAINTDYSFSDTKALEEEVAKDLKENWGIELITTPGHTPCSISVWRPEISEIYVCDLFAVRMMGKGPPIDWHPLQTDKKQMDESIQKVLDLNPKTIFVSHVSVKKAVTCEHIEELTKFKRKKVEEEEEETEGEKVK